MLDQPNNMSVPPPVWLGGGTAADPVLEDRPHPVPSLLPLTIWSLAPVMAPFFPPSGINQSVEGSLLIGPGVQGGGAVSTVEVKRSTLTFLIRFLLLLDQSLIGW